MRSTPRTLPLLALSASALLGACGGSTAPEPHFVQRIIVEPESAVLALGDSLRFHATAVDQTGEVVHLDTFAWDTRAREIVRVDRAGLVWAMSLGEDTVAAGAGGVDGLAPVRVRIAPFEPNQPLELDARPVDDLPHPAEALEAEPRPGRIVVRGSAAGPCAGTRLFAAARRRGNELDLRVAADALVDCPTTLEPYRYEAVLRDLPAGEYRLRVTHGQDASRNAEGVLLDTVLVVPGA